MESFKDPGVSDGCALVVEERQQKMIDNSRWDLGREFELLDDSILLVFVGSRIDFRDRASSRQRMCVTFIHPGTASGVETAKAKQ